MADVPVEVKKVAPAQTNVPDVWHSFRSEMDRLFDRFSSGFGFPSLRRMFDVEPAWRPASSFSFAAPAIDIIECLLEPLLGGFAAVDRTADGSLPTRAVGRGPRHWPAQAGEEAGCA